MNPKGKDKIATQASHSRTASLSQISDPGGTPPWDVNSKERRRRSESRLSFASKLTEGLTSTEWEILILSTIIKVLLFPA